MSLTDSGGEACDEAWVCPGNLCFLLLESLETVKGHSPAMQTPGLWLSAQLKSSAQTDSLFFSLLIIIYIILLS